MKVDPASQHLSSVIMFVVLLTTVFNSACNGDRVVTARLHTERTRFRVGEHLYVEMEIHNGRRSPIELVGTLYPVAYGTVLSESPLSLRRMETSDELRTANEQSVLPPRPKESISSFPLLEIYVVAGGELLMADWPSGADVMVKPGECWRHSIDIAPLLPGPGEYIVVGSLNQPSGKYKNPVLALTTEPLTLRIEKHDVPNK